MEQNKIIINFCPTGMVPTKSMNANVPISPSEIIEQVHEAFEVGITIAHLHARLDKGEPTYKKNIYHKIFEGVRKYCPGLIICGSTSGRNFSEFEKRSEVIELYPDMCSLTLSSLNFVNTASLNSPNMIEKLYDKMMDYGVIPEMECFDLGMINYGKYLLQKYNNLGNNYWNLIFGNIAGFQVKNGHISAAINDIPEGDFITMGGIGKYQLPINSFAIERGLGVRVGLEDNLWFDAKKNIAATNMTLIKRIHQKMKSKEKELMTSSELGALGFYNKKKNLG